jgi:hypothetical protein
MERKPYSFKIETPDLIPSHYDHHIQRRLSDMKG